MLLENVGALLSRQQECRRLLKYIIQANLILLQNKIFSLFVSVKAGVPSPWHDNTLDSEQNEQCRHSCWAPTLPVVVCSCKSSSDKKHERPAFRSVAFVCFFLPYAMRARISSCLRRTRARNINFKAETINAVGVDFWGG